jgi:ribulose-phosphate 3-epimerase
MTTDPASWIDPFLEAGADGFIFCYDSAKDPGGLIKEIKACGKMAGVSLLLSESVELLTPFWADLDVVCMMGTAVGIKGASLDASVPNKIRRAREEIRRRGLRTEVEVDGGIRRETVPLLRAAGADWIVPGSLLFNDDPPAVRRWLAAL